MLNQTPIRGQRIGNAATSLGDEAALDLSDVLAEPFIVMRSDHQDALSAGLAVSEYAPAGKSAEEICSLWQMGRDPAESRSDCRRAAHHRRPRGVAGLHVRDVLADPGENGCDRFLKRLVAINAMTPPARPLQPVKRERVVCS